VLNEVDILKSGKSQEINMASATAMSKLNDTLISKIDELKSATTSANTRIETIVKQVKLDGDQFDTDMSSRISAYDNDISKNDLRIGEIAKSVTKLQTDMENTGKELNVLQNNARLALDVANRLSSGTVSGQLPMIGSVLEKAFIISIAAIVIAIIAILTTVVAFRRLSGSRMT
jgi:chromosome segregation ATPase